MGHPRDLHVLQHSFPTRRSSDLSLGELTAGLTRRPLLVADAEVLTFIQTRLEACFGDRPHEILAFRGEVTHAAIDGLAASGTALGADAVIGIGGGKGRDAAKGVAFKLGLPFIAVPRSEGQPLDTPSI